MLLLKRSINESIMIGDYIEVKVARVEGSNVCLAIDAPRELIINRKEHFKRIKMAINSNSNKFETNKL